MIRKSHPKISLSRQCKYLDLSRSSQYISPKGESALNLELMDKIDKHYLKHPYKGCPRMYVYLKEDLGYKISYNRVERLYYKVMGLRAIIPGPHTSKRNRDHPVFPYLLRDYEIKEKNQVWATDITYIGIEKGYIYMTAIIDIYSRYIVGWSLSNNMTSEWCTEVYKEAVKEHGVPHVMNTDQGAQYTSKEFSGKGRATDNAFIERFWRSIKYEKLHLYKPQDGLEAYLYISEYIDYYNNERRHSMLENRKPVDVYSSARLHTFQHS